MLKNWAVCLIILITEVACTNVYNVSITADRQLNPDQWARSLPLQVKIYELNNKETFLHASFRDLWLHDRETLGDNLIKTESIFIMPMHTILLRLRRNSEVAYIGIVAIFRMSTIAHWRAITIVPRRFKKSVKVYASSNMITIY